MEGRKGKSILHTFGFCCFHCNAHSGRVTYWKAADLIISWFSQHDVMYLQCNNKYSSLKIGSEQGNSIQSPDFTISNLPLAIWYEFSRTKPCQNKAHQTQRKGEVSGGVFPKLILNPDSGFHHLTFVEWQKRERADDVCKRAFTWIGIYILLYPQRKSQLSQIATAEKYCIMALCRNSANMRG